jgi:photosystem II stability/assembly factor-like uncharacterized protein
MRIPPPSVTALTCLLLASSAAANPVIGDEPEKLKLDADWLEAMPWRSLGPASMGGRCVAIAVSATDSSKYWVATASGGLLKTSNAGMTYEHQFDHESSVSIGHVAVAPSDDSILWVGTGEANPRNSVSYGDGVYKSEDGGATWKRMGLEDSFQIGRIAIHPTDPDVVYVGALGRLYGTNEERGLYKSTDGGKEWEKVLNIDERTGVIDVDMHPTEPDTLIVATYERQRDNFDTNTPAKSWGPGSGLYRTKDGGHTWMKLTSGLPTVELGRIGVDYSHQHPNTVFAVVESERIGSLPDDVAYMGMSGEDADVGARITRLTEEGPAEDAGFKEGDIVLSMGEQKILGYEDLLLAIREHKTGEKVIVELVRERELTEIELEFRSYEAGSSGLRPFSSFLGGQRENMQDSQGPDGFQTGGIYKSTDGGETWNKINSLNPRPMYYSQIRVDPSDDQRIYVLGTSFWKSEDGGETFEGGRFGPGVHVDHHSMWIDPADGRHMILGNDGGIYVSHDRTETWDHHNQMAIGQFYHVTTDFAELYSVYGGLQDNGSWGGPNRTRERSGTVNSDWFNVGGGDGFVCRVDPEDNDVVFTESQGGFMGWRNLRTGERGSARPSSERGKSYRFNWETPFLLSKHNSRVFYAAGNYVFRSLNRGEGLRSISPEITLTDRGSATALAESPRDKDMLWVGTDDGALWVTRDGGLNWTDLRQDPPADGLVDPSERRAQVLALLVSGLDADEDGSVAKSEVPERLMEVFERADIDGDGVLDEREQRLVTGTASSPATDPINDTWTVTVAGEAVPPVGSEFELAFERDGELRRAGTLDSEKHDGILRSLNYDEESGSLSFSFTAGDVELDFDAVVGSGSIEGTISIEAGDFEAAISAVRKVDDDDKKEKKPKKPKKAGPTFAEVMPKPMWITGLEASRHERERIYVAVDGHRSDDDAPYAFVSEDAGVSWRSITKGLPRGSVRVIREDLVNEDVLYLGTEFSAWISIDRGVSWTKVKGLPTVAIHEFAQSPATGDVVVGTHGRSLWAFDATTLRQFNADALADPAMLYAPHKAVSWRSFPNRATSGTRRFVGQNPPTGVRIQYSLGERAKSVELSILGAGETLYAFKEDDLERKSGLHTVTWNLRRSSSAGQQQEQSRRRRSRGSRVPHGTYQVLLVVDGQRQTQPLILKGDPDYPEFDPAREEEEEEQHEDEYELHEYDGDR